MFDYSGAILVPVMTDYRRQGRPIDVTMTYRRD
jgi:hypothetical protein